MNAAVANFQFTGSRQDFHHSTRSAETFHSSCLEANGSMQSTNYSTIADDPVKNQARLRAETRAGCSVVQPGAVVKVGTAA